MEIFINKEVFSIPENFSISELIFKTLNHSGKGIAIAIDENIIPKSEWEKYILKNNEKLILITATQGG